MTGAGISDEDRRHINHAVDAAIAGSVIDVEVYNFIRDVLTTDLVRGDHRGYSRRRVIRFAMKFQQYTAPVMAKSSEDTAFYRFNRLIVLSEVGGDPTRYGVSLAEFHDRNTIRAAHWPATMLATMTHDAKRGEDVRARLCVLSEIGADWAKAALSWHRLNTRPQIQNRVAIDPDDEFLLYQTLLGSWPIEWTGRAPERSEELSAYNTRLHRYMVKSIREAKLRSSWVRPDTAYEDKIGCFIGHILDPAENADFLGQFIAFQSRIAIFGAVNGLAQTLLRLSAPGMPDTYQGSDLWDLRLVDPDNRSPVDFRRRDAMLAALEASLSASREPSVEHVVQLMANWRDGRIKLYVLWRALSLRAAYPNLFAHGSYVPLKIEGTYARQVVAFARIHRNRVAIVAVPRLIAGAGIQQPTDFDWADTAIVLDPSLHKSRFRNHFSGGRIVPDVRSDRDRILPLAALFGHLPLALLVSDDQRFRNSSV